jgi:hypothetical protein
MAKKPVPLFWLTYRHSDGSAAGVVVIGFGGSAGVLTIRQVSARKLCRCNPAEDPGPYAVYIDIALPLSLQNGAR